MRTILLASAALVMIGCASMGPRPISLTSMFDASEVAWATGTGTNNIKVSALLRQTGGAVVTCAGTPLDLIPAGTYSSERIAKAYGNTVGGFRTPMQLYQQGGLPDHPPGYHATYRTKICDPQGFATFAEIPDGDYYLTAQITWSTGYTSPLLQEGGYLMQRVSVKGSETKEVVLTY